MNSQALSSWVQAIGAIAILGRVGLVVWELQQARESLNKWLTNGIIGYLSSAVKDDGSSDVFRS
jgi:cyanate permease